MPLRAETQAAVAAPPATPQNETGKQAAKTSAGTAQSAGTPQSADKTSPAEHPDKSPPAVTGGTPTVTDTAALTLPGWVEFDPGSLKNLDRDRVLGTPLLFKVTDKNQRLQYRLASDGYIRAGDHTDGIGDTYLGLHDLLASQEKAGFDLAGRFTIKLPTASDAVGGTHKFDYFGLFLASRDFTKWGLHGDFNIGLSSLSRQAAAGVDTQYLLTGSLTVPIRGGRWQYTNELVYFSPIAGQRGRVTTMHGFSYAVHRYEVYGAALQWQLHGDGANFQVLVAGSFMLGRLF